MKCSLPKENKEVTFELTFSNDFIGAYDSFITRLSSIYHNEIVSANPQFDRVK